METKDKKRLISAVLLVLLVLYGTFYQMVLVKNYLKYADVITSVVLIIVTFIAYQIIGYRNDKATYLKKQVFKNTLLILASYFAIIYLLGIKIGFLKNSYSLQLLDILKNILSPIVLVIASEFLRYILISGNKVDESGKNSKLIVILTTITLIVIDLTPQISLRMFSSNARIFSIVTSIIIPSITKNIVLSYLTSQCGYKTSLLYRIIMDLYIYLVPIFPDLNDYFMSMLGILLPFAVYLQSSRIINTLNDTKEEKLDRSVIYKAGDVAIAVVAVILISLVSTKFSYFLLGIASGSMEPSINIGDAVLAHKIDKDEKLKVGDIVVFEMNGVKIVHRINKCDKDENGNDYYVTKGDANGSSDNNRLYIGDIEAKVIVTIPFIGMPTVWASELLG